MSKGLRSQLYRAARDMGNVQAATGKQGVVKGSAKRYARRCVYRKTNQLCSHRLCKALGLW